MIVAFLSGSIFGLLLAGVFFCLMLYFMVMDEDKKGSKRSPTKPAQPIAVAFDETAPEPREITYH
jgi:hypothetical protein